MEKVDLFSSRLDLAFPIDYALKEATECLFKVKNVAYNSYLCNNATEMSPVHVQPLAIINGQLISGFEDISEKVYLFNGKDNGLETNNHDFLENAFFIWLSDSLRNIVLYFTWLNESTSSDVVFDISRKKTAYFGLPYTIFFKPKAVHSYLKAIEWDRKSPEAVVAIFTGICEGIDGAKVSGPYMLERKVPGKIDALIYGYWKAFKRFDKCFHLLKLTREKFTAISKLVDLIESNLK